MGAPVEIDTRVALGLTMALNELATNALKYGALSGETGSLSLTWDTQRNSSGSLLLNLNWRERGGPSVLPPLRRGLGTRLMERCIERDLGGEFDLAFNSDGVLCQFSVPISVGST